MDTNKFNDTFEGNTPHVAFIVFWYLHSDGVYKVKSYQVMKDDLGNVWN